MRTLIRRLRRSLLEFIAVPALIVIGFVALAEGVDWLDNHAGPRHAWGPLRTWLAQYVGDTQAAIGVLSAIAGSLFTVTSITFSILLLAVQQGATVLNSQIVDHYLRRGSNRAWFGFFVGVSLFALLTLVQTTHTSAPVFGVMVSTLFGALSLLALVILIYGTIDQTRPVTVIGTIVTAARIARERQQPLLAASRQPADATSGTIVPAGESGYLLRVDFAGLQRLIDRHADLNIAIAPTIGAFVAKGDPLATLSGETDDSVRAAVAAALPIAEQRDITDDASYSLHHIHTIGWTAISTARSDPAVGTIAINAVRSLSATWCIAPARADADARLSYDDRLPPLAFDTFESLMVASTESRQHQTLALLLDTLAAMLPTLPADALPRIAALADTAARLGGGHTPTRVLHDSFATFAAACRRRGLVGAADRLDATRDGFDTQASPPN